ncbi:MAG: class I SAM-dependent RNA methyltransferase [Acidimicrobiales bacterium]
MPDPSETLDIDTHAIAVGGDAVGRDDDGRAVFVAGALAGERVRVQVRSEHRRYAHADLVEVLDPSPDRIAPVCPHVADGCGGCGFAHVAPGAQRRLKVEMITEALERIGRLAAPVVEPGPELALTGFRTTVRAAVVDGRAGYRPARGSGRVAVESCRVADPLVEELLVAGDFPDASEVVLRVGARTGERLALVTPSAEGVRLPDDVRVVGLDQLRSGTRSWYHEEVAGVRLRISAESFFQSRPDGAEALVDAVSDALAAAPPSASLSDLYCGVGLFAATVGRGRRVIAVERSRSSVADARVNLSGADATVVASPVERWRASAVDLVVADPPRSGLAKPGVAVVNATGARHLALVSCDAGSLGRDAGLLVAAGWRHDWSRLVDLFVDTPHVEVVSSFTR